MDLKQIEEGSFDVSQAVRFLAKEVAGLKSATMQGLLPETMERKRSLHELLDSRVVDALVQAGYDTTRAVQEATDEELRAVDGIGPVTVQVIRKKV